MTIKPCSRRPTDEGLRPVNVSVISVNGQRRYTSLFRKVDYGSMIFFKSQLDEAEYQHTVNENKAAGRKPVYVAAYMHNGKPELLRNLCAEAARRVARET